MISNPAFISLRDIDTSDTSFKITTRTNIEDILQSIGDAGIINPPIVKRLQEKFIIVSGFRRISACLRIGNNEVAARIIEPDVDEKEVVKIAILDNTTQRALNLVEESRAFTLLSGCMDDEAVLETTSAMLGLPANISLINKIKRIVDLPWIVQQAVADGFISLLIALELASIESDVAVCFTKLFRDLKTGLNKQREILATSIEIARRDDISLLEVVNDDYFQEIISDDDSDKGQKSNRLRTYLKKRRFPEITKREDEFKSGLNSLGLGKDITLHPPDSFEGEYFSLHIRFKDLKGLKNHSGTISRLLQNPVMKNMVLKQ